MPDPTPPLTTLSEDEELFRRTVRDFAERAVRPRVAAMEQSASLDRALLAQCFQLGLMGIEIPEAHGGAGGSMRSEEHTSELQSQSNLVCRLLLEKKKTSTTSSYSMTVIAALPSTTL